MKPLAPNQSVAALTVEQEAIPELTLITPIADLGVYEIQTLTFLSKAATGAADFVVIENAAGTKFAVWLDTTGTDVEPAGVIYSAADTKIRVDISGQTTAAQVATAVFTAISASITNVVVTNPSSAVVTLTNSKLGNVDAPVPKDSAEATAGTIAGATTTAGVASNLQNTYFKIRNAADAKFHVWMNVGSEGVDPAPATSTGIEVAVPASSTAAAIATLVAAAVTADSNFDAEVVNLTNIQIHNAGTGNITDSADEDSGFTVSKLRNGRAADYIPSIAASSISNNP